ncbi:nuclear pore complex protein Nup154 [Agrilus planipennis]|uniref:Nuclear pore complex protein Nup154 n=1 Tax=Agrilus planipennis TaxID=224129 RepID=A0A1W4WA12_AGRPL|nr:nuclear pore complex protein Nup154 [Agrilus planipennis]
MTLIQSAGDQPSEISRQSHYSLESAVHNLEWSLVNDGSAPSLLEKMNVNQQTGPTASGLTEHDYPTLSGLSLSLNNLTQIRTLSKVPLPPEIMEHFSHIQQHCMMGLFTEINRGWLTIDSDIYVWSYEDGSDVAYYDGINETIIGIGLVKPKDGVFHDFIKFLLIVTTAVDIVVLGITFTSGTNDPYEEIHLVPDPIFTVPSDGCLITIIEGSNLGRIFLGSKDGCLYELVYQSESSWLGKRCKKINHSTSALSYFMPSFINAALSEEDCVVQISIDNSRHILYLLMEKGSIEVYDLGEKGNSLSKITKQTQASLVQQAMNIVKTLDSQNFRPIVNISAIESSESLYLNLVAITQTGVRFYFSIVGLSNLQPNQRPYTLTLLHVRLPPGYSATMTSRPRMVHMANCSAGNMLLISSVNESDALWCVSSDMFPFTSAFMELHTTITLDGPAWAMAEIRHTLPGIKVPQPQREDPPLVVRQHLEPPRKYVVLTAQGAHIFMKLRPVDVLRQLLCENQGPENDSVRGFFVMQKEDQACATSLILACSDNVENHDVAEWATRSFFLYGGEPRIMSSQLINTNKPMFSGNTTFLPEIISTPRPATNTQLTQNISTHPGNGFTFSAKHNGLYIFLSRILRPVWFRNCVQKVNISNGKFYLSSALPIEECVVIIGHLSALSTFLHKNTQLSVILTSGISDMINQSNLTKTPPKVSFKANQSTQDLQLEERQSLSAFKTFVNHSCQVLGLWNILCEHQFHELISSLPETHQHVMQTMCFKDFILYAGEIYVELINSLINSYIGDNASVDSISLKLRSVCPNLYRSEDAACTKANEILKGARTIQNKNEIEEMLCTALSICKSVAPNINLREICQQFVSLGAYNAVLDLCVDCAKKIDPDNIGEHYYKNGEQREHEDYHLYSRRIAIYNEIKNMLDHLYSQSDHDVLHVTSQPASSVIQRVIDMAMEYDDELLHVAIYEWLVSKNLVSDLIKITLPSLEYYLVRAAHQNSDNIVLQDILWKLYENNNNHAAAAKILNNLASNRNNSLTLKDRLAYLARAVMCMRSDKVGYAPHLGVFLRELEDKLEIAKVQEKVLESITNQHHNNPSDEEAIVSLNCNLYEVTQLYEDFCDPFNLWECKLAIIECSGYTDTSLIELIWHNILQNEVRRTAGLPLDRMNHVLNEVKRLYNLYKNSNICFPLPFIVAQLEIISSKLKVEPGVVPTTLFSYGVPLDTLINIYISNLNAASADRFWSIEENYYRLCEVFGATVDLFITHNEDFSSVIKRKIISVCQDTISGLLTNLYGKTNTTRLIDKIRQLQTAMSRL